MTGRKFVILILLAASFLGLSSCNLGQAAPTEQDPNQVYTQLWVTVAAAQSQTARVSPPTTGPTAGPTVTPEASVTSGPTNTPLLSPTPQPGAATNTRAVSPNPGGSRNTCDNALFIDDVTIPDGTILSPGQTFIKTWRFQNLGPCTWNTNYELFLSYQSSGAGWLYIPPISFPSEIDPGEYMDISVTLVAPTTPGAYEATFRLANDKRGSIGDNANFGPEFWVSVVIR